MLLYKYLKLVSGLNKLLQNRTTPLQDCSDKWIRVNKSCIEILECLDVVPGLITRMHICQQNTLITADPQLCNPEIGMIVLLEYFEYSRCMFY